MKSLKQNASTLLFILFEAIVGVLLLYEPEKFTKAVVLAIAAVFVLIGIVSLITYLVRRKKEQDKSTLSLIKSMISLTIGLVFLILSFFLSEILAVIAIIYGIYFLVSGIVKTQTFFIAKKIGFTGSIFSLISAFLSIVFGVYIIIYHLKAAQVWWMFIGITMIIEAIIDLIYVIAAMIKPKNEKEIVVEAKEIGSSGAKENADSSEDK